MAEPKISDKQRRMLDRWEKFLEAQCGVYPATLAAVKLGMTTSGVYNAAERGWLTFFQIGRDRWYGKKDVVRYRSEVSRVFRDNRPLPSPSPKNFSEDIAKENKAVQPVRAGLVAGADCKGALPSPRRSGFRAK